VSQFQSSYFGLLALIILASSVLSLRLQSDLLTYTISAIASIIVINSTLILASGLEYRGLLTVYSGYIFCISLIGALGLLEAAGHLLDLGYIVILLLLLTIYHYNTGLRELLTAELPIILIASVILGVYVGLHNPLRYSVTALIDAVSLIVVSSTGEDIVLFLAASLLVFTVLYAIPTLMQSTVVFTLMLTIYIVRAVLVLLKRMRVFKAVLILDILLRPVLVAYL